MSQNKMNMNDDLLVKYLVGETDPDENATVEIWLKADEKNQNYYNDFKKIWDDSLVLAQNTTVDENAAWKRLQNRIQEKDVPVNSLKKSSFNWLQIAASVLLISTLGGLGYSYFENKSANTLITIHATSTTLNDTLPDGTTITLNKNSSLTYTQKFKGNTRPVTLKGEAFFNVSPDKSKPFIITINDVTVQVVGTSFNVKHKNGKTTVDVETGIVKVSKNKDQVELKHGEKVIISDPNLKLLKSISKGRLYNYYRNKELVCDQTPLQELVEALNEIYNVNISIKNPELQEKPITTIFKDQSLDQILEVIQETFVIEIERKNNQILLK
ncbi:FecR family protein [Flavobacterium sp. 90]|uniref:FecR domain-containing protein n=1 Tax=unclassified Flavobacterium TaxID=196869 RepID=UPI000EAD616E|nr:MULTISPECIES: FecR domain-containing protein [unclassified Flavobacterium]RKR04970.1 FecR family protein [Flavobacterium sp. 81]TCK56289.1 FecR family protein [Flavobacterium sp. 90]